MGWLAIPERFLKPGKARVVFLLVAAVAFFFTELGRYVYRPFVRRNATRPQSYRFATFLAAGYILYEFVQPALPRGVFDWKDVFGTIIGYGISVLLLTAVWSTFSDTAEMDQLTRPRDGETPGCE